MNCRAGVPLSLLLSLACGSSSPPTGAPPTDARAEETAPDARGRAEIEAEIEAILVARSAAAGVQAFGLTVWDAADRRLYQYMAGGFTADTRVAIASASKLVATIVIFDVIRRGQLTLDSSTGQVLGWTGPGAAITLRHLLSFTSGLPREASCTLNALITLAACVETIASAPLVAAPGLRFDYGSTHLHVAARMAEVATGRTWEQLFDQTLRKPLGLPDEVAFFTFPRQASGRSNPLVAGGMRASTADYAPLLALAFHQGTLGNVTAGSPDLFAAQTHEPFPQAVIGYTPFPPGRYGLGSWLMCAAPASGCPLVTSPGAFGFTPWLDREAGYYAIMAMELASTGNDDRPAEFAVQVLTELQPLIRARLGR